MGKMASVNKKIVIFVILLIIIGGGIFFYWQKKNIQREKEKLIKEIADLKDASGQSESKIKLLNDTVVSLDKENIDIKKSAANLNYKANRLDKIKIKETPAFYYMDGGEDFPVSTAEFVVLEKFNAGDLTREAEICKNDKNIDYYIKLLKNYNLSDKGGIYSFSLKENSPEAWKIIAIPNKINYKNKEDFFTDFKKCAEDEEIAPLKISDNFLLFIENCQLSTSTVATSTPCLIKNIIEPNIIIK